MSTPCMARVLWKTALSGQQTSGSGINQLGTIECESLTSITYLFTQR